MRSNGVNFILLVQRRKKNIGLRLRYVVERESIGKGKERYDVIEIVYVQLHELILLFASKGILAIGDLFDFCRLLCMGFFSLERRRWG